MIVLINAMSNLVVSRHRTLEAAEKASKRLDRSLIIEGREDPRRESIETDDNKLYVYGQGWTLNI